MMFDDDGEVNMQHVKRLWRNSTIENGFGPVGNQLAALAKDPAAKKRSLEARSTTVSLRKLHKLAGDELWIVRGFVADNPRTPVSILRALVYDESAYVRAMVAANVRTPIADLYTLANDPEVQVRRAVAANVDSPPEALAIIALLDRF